MSDDSSSPCGLLSESERELLMDEEAPTERRNAVRKQVRDRLQATLRDMSVLYPTLRDADVEAVFCADDDSDQSAIRAATQDALGLLVLGMLTNDDLLETRLSDALRYAGLAYGEEITVDLNLRRSPRPTFEQCLARFETDEVTEATLSLYEALIWQTDTDAEQVAAAGQRLGFDTSPEGVRKERAAIAGFTRPPQTAITDIDVNYVTQDDTREET